MEDCSFEHPHMASRSRAIHLEEDTPGGTSFETYLKGELSTYSLQILRLYHQYTLDLLKKGINMNTLILENIAKNYGYTSLEQAEASLKN